MLGLGFRIGTVASVLARLPVLPTFASAPSISPTSGSVGATFTATDGTVNNGTVVSRRWLLGGVAIGTGATVVPVVAGALVLENTATGPSGTTIATSAAVTVSASASKPGNVGMNLSPVAYYSNTHPFLNRLKTADDFASYGSVDANGYPTAAQSGLSYASTQFSIEPKTTGISNRWLIISNGTMPITLGAGNGSAPTLVDGSNARRMVYDYTDTVNSQCRIKIDFSGGGTRPTSIAVVRIDQESLYNSGELFNPAFVASCAQWSVLRFMDWTATNYFSGQTGNTSWAARPTQSYLTWAAFNSTTGVGGVPPEVCAALCVEAGCDMWYNVPFKYARTSWQAAFAALKTVLGSQKLHVEYGNEVWNFGFQQTQDSFTAGQATTVNGQAGNERTYYGQQLCQVAQDAITAYAGARSQLVTHMGVQQVKPSTYTDAELGFQSLGFEVGQLIDEVSGTFYIYGGVTYSNAAAGTSTTQKTTVLNLANAVNAGGSGATTALNTVFAQIYDGGQTGFTSPPDDGPTIAGWKATIDSWTTLANSKGWEYGTYEGQLYHWPLGVANPTPPTFGWTSAEEAILLPYINTLRADSRTAGYIGEMFAYARAKVRGLFMVYFDLRVPDAFGPWGTKSLLYDADTPLQVAYKSWQASPTVSAPAYAALALSYTPGTLSVGTAVSGKPIFTGGAVPRSITVYAGSLPTGVSFDGYRFSGTPTTAGAYSYTLRGTDGLGNHVDTVISGTVVASLPAYKVFELVTYDTGSTTAQPVDISEFAPLDKTGAAISLSGITAYATDSYDPVGYGPAKCFDGSTSTYWESASNPSAGTPIILRGTLPTGIRPASFNLSGSNFNFRFPGKFIIRAYLNTLSDTPVTLVDQSAYVQGSDTSPHNYTNGNYVNFPAVYGGSN